MHANLIFIPLLLAQLGGDTPAGKLPLDRCLVTAIDHVAVPAEEAGVISEIKAPEGTTVSKGDAIAQINDSDTRMRLKAAQMEYNVALEKAKNIVNITAAQAAAEVAKAEMNESVAINQRRPGAIPPTQLRREELTHKRAEMQIEVAKFEYTIAGMEAEVSGVQVEAVQAELARRLVDSPVNGEVVRVLRRAGEWVQPGEPILQVVRMDRLRVEGFVDAKKFLPSQIYGRTCDVILTLPGMSPIRRTAYVNYVSPLVEASGEFRVWVDLDNEKSGNFWLFRPGMDAKLVIDLNSAPRAPANPNPRPVQPAGGTLNFPR